jgi:AhpD family alkylhydroperoxidase
MQESATAVKPQPELPAPRAALPRTKKESVLLAVAAAYGNTYCVTESHQALRLLGVPDRQLDQIGIDHLGRGHPRT